MFARMSWRLSSALVAADLDLHVGGGGGGENLNLIPGVMVLD